MRPDNDDAWINKGGMYKNRMPQVKIGNILRSHILFLRFTVTQHTILHLNFRRILNT